jgi:hypothetical protein
MTWDLTPFKLQYTQLMNRSLELELSALFTTLKHCSERGHKMLVEKAKNVIINYLFSKHRMSKQERLILKLINF